MKLIRNRIIILILWNFWIYLQQISQYLIKKLWIMSNDKYIVIYSCKFTN